MSTDQILEKYGLIGVMVLMLPYFIKSVSPMVKDVLAFVFSSSKMRAEAKQRREEENKLRDEVIMQARLQHDMSKTEHERWMYENTFSVLKENLVWIRQQFGVVQKEEDKRLTAIWQEIKIISGQLSMLTKAMNRMIEITQFEGAEIPTWGAKGGNSNE